MNLETDMNAAMRIVFVCLASTALAACGPGLEETAESFDMRDLRNTQLTVSGDCLETVWSHEVTPDRRFDRANDAVEGGSLSCATGASPRKFAAVLAEMRTASESSDRPTLLAMVNEPLLFIGQDGSRRELATRAQIESEQDAVLTPELLEAMAAMSIDRVTVVPDQGAFFDLGAVWLASRREGSPPVIVTVNLQALKEARSAAD